jgi:hypothetical protein
MTVALVYTRMVISEDFMLFGPARVGLVPLGRMKPLLELTQFNFLSLSIMSC